MIVEAIPELTVAAVLSRGEPNRERIAIYVREATEMGQYGLLLGIRHNAGFAYPLRDNFFWFGDGSVQQEDWLFVYTGPGEPRTEPIPGAASKIYSMHWGRAKTILSHQEVVPILIRINGIHVPAEEAALLKAGDQSD